MLGYEGLIECQASKHKNKNETGNASASHSKDLIGNSSHCLSYNLLILLGEFSIGST